MVPLLTPQNKGLLEIQFSALFSLLGCFIGVQTLILKPRFMVAVPRFMVAQELVFTFQ